MKKIVFIASLFYCSTLYAQQYINNGLIEYQVRVDNYKSMGDDSWGRSFRDRMPNFSVSYFDLIFNNNKAIYKFNRQDKTNNQGFFLWTEVRRMITSGLTIIHRALLPIRKMFLAISMCSMTVY